MSYQDFIVSTVARRFPSQDRVEIKRLVKESLKLERPRGMKDELATTTRSLRFVTERLEAKIRESADKDARAVDFDTFWKQFTATTSLVVGIGSLGVGVGSYYYAKQMATQRRPHDDPPIELGSRRPSNSNPRPVLGPGRNQSGELPTNNGNDSGIRSPQTSPLPQQSLSVVSPDDISEREQENQSPIRLRLREETNDNSTNHSGSSTPRAIDLNPESKSFQEEANAVDETQNRLHRRKDIELQEMVDKMNNMITDKNSTLDTLPTSLDQQLGESSCAQPSSNTKCLQHENTQRQMAQDMEELQEQVEDIKTQLEVANAHHEQEKREHDRNEEEMETKNKESSLQLRCTSDVRT